MRAFIITYEWVEIAYETPQCTNDRQLKKVAAPTDFVIPQPKPFQITDGNFFGAVTGAIALVLRLGTGVFAIDKKTLAGCNRPTKNIIIYEYEASPFCRKVREACAILDLTVEYRPCPGARTGFSDEMAKRTGGRRTVPYLECMQDKAICLANNSCVRVKCNLFGRHKWCSFRIFLDLSDSQTLLTKDIY